MRCIQRLLICVRVGWRLFHEVRQILYGMYKILRLPRPCVSIFGGTHLSAESPYAHQAFTLAQALVKKKIAVLTGGGGGIMQAASCGAADQSCGKNHTVMGIGISGIPNEIPINPCVCEYIILDYFFSRKWLLINYSVGFVVFPGGLGTLDEVSDLLNLIHTGRREPVPVILVGKAFWKFYVDWLETAQQAGLIIHPTSTPIVTVTDDSEEILELLIRHCSQC